MLFDLNDSRDYSAAAHILKALGVLKLTLLSNNPEKTRALEALGLNVVEQRPLVIEANPFNATYLATKRNKLGHSLASKVRN